jgi:glycerol-3-phosphate O-acyltransferase
MTDIHQTPAPFPAPPPPSGTGRRPAGGGWLDRFLQGTLHHYVGVLPGAFGRLRDTLLRLFYSGVRLEEPQASALREIPPQAIVVFASRFRCAFPFLFAHTRYRSLGLPFPRIGIGCKVLVCRSPLELARIATAAVMTLWRKRRLPDPTASGYCREQFLDGKAGFLTLLHAPGRLRRWFQPPPVDPMEFLIALQKSTDRPVMIVPQIVFFTRNPHRARPTLMDMLFGPEDEPGRLRLLAALFKKAGNVFVELSAPIDLQRFLSRADLAGHAVPHQAAILRRETLAQIQRHRQSITGPVVTPREELKQRIMDSDRCQQLMQSHAETHGLPLPEVRASVADCIDEIAADLRPNWIRFYSGPVGCILNSLFDGVALNREGLDAVKRSSLRGPVVYVPCHKSHADYLILSYILYHHDLPCPLVAAGKNLSFWPMGPLFRRGGAFFIRRSFRGAVLYSRVFSEYVHAILQEGHSVEQFIEGGRSRTGKLLMPKLGLLSILLTALRNGACEDLIFVPVSIGYDRVLEEKSYLQEIEGGQKQPENVWQVLKARKFLRRRWGKVYLQFNRPLSANDQARGTGTDLRSMEPKELNGFCRSLAHRIACGIDRVTVATPHALAAAAILNLGRDRFSLEEVLSAVNVYAAHLEAVGAKSADTLVMDHRRAIAHALDSYAQRRIIEPAGVEASDGESRATEFLVRESRRPVLDYYKNTCVVHFMPAAFAALAILERDAFQFSAADLQTDFEFLQELMRLEFVQDSDTEPPEQLRRALRIFYENATLVPHPSLPETYNLTSAGFRTLKLFAMFLKTFLESYWVVLAWLNSEQAPDEPRERLKKIAAFGNRMYRQKEIDHREALSKVTYENALELFLAHGIRGAEDRNSIDAFAAVIRRALRCLASPPGRPLNP